MSSKRNFSSRKMAHLKKFLRAKPKHINELAMCVKPLTDEQIEFKLLKGQIEYSMTLLTGFGCNGKPIPCHRFKYTKKQGEANVVKTKNY